MKSQKSRRKRPFFTRARDLSQRGILLAEVMMSIIIVSIVSLIAFMPYVDGHRSLMSSIKREQAFALIEQMIEYYKGVGYDGMNLIPQSGEDHSTITIDNVQYTRKMEFQTTATYGGGALQYEDPNPPTNGDGAFHEYTSVQQIGGQIETITTRFRGIRCTISWENKSINVDSVVVE